MKYYIIAGERSGDLHGSNLIRQLKKRDKSAQIRCWGGDAMQQAGGELVVHYRDISFMGLWETLVNLRMIWRHLRFCKKDILKFKPDVLVLIDYPGFNLRIARFAHEQGLKVSYYISPKVWAWNSSRALKIKTNVDQLLTILPFEKEFYKKYDFEVEYVGNPVMDAINDYRVDPDFLEKSGLPEDKSIVALLPGSRTQELRQTAAVLKQTAASFPEYHFAVAAVKNVDQKLYDPILGAPNVSLVFEKAYDLLAFADGAVVTSGTATLETALWDVPQVVIYKTSPLTYGVGRLVVNVEYISLVNLIAGKEVVKELIQGDMNAEKLSYEVGQIMKNKEKRQQILLDYRSVREKLAENKASENAANKIIDLAKQRDTLDSGSGNRS